MVVLEEGDMPHLVVPPYKALQMVLHHMVRMEAQAVPTLAEAEEALGLKEAQESLPQAEKEVPEYKSGDNIIPAAVQVQVGKNLNPVEDRTLEAGVLHGVHRESREQPTQDQVVVPITATQ